MIACLVSGSPEHMHSVSISIYILSSCVVRLSLSLITPCSVGNHPEVGIMKSWDDSIHLYRLQINHAAVSVPQHQI